jgi:hypothetical protein
MNLLSFAQISDFLSGKGNKFNYFVGVFSSAEERSLDSAQKSSVKLKVSP